MSLEDYKLIHSANRLQAIVFTSNGFLLDSCNTLIDLSNYKSVSLFKVLPFLNQFKHFFGSLEEDVAKQFSRVELEWEKYVYMLDISIMRKNGKLVCVMEDMRFAPPLKKSESQQPAPSSNTNRPPVISADTMHPAQTELEKMRKMQQIRQDHFSKITHDIKLPLTEIIGTTYILQNHVLNEKGQDYLKALSNSARNLDTMLKDLVAFSKSESYKFKIESRCFPPENVLDSVVKAFDFKSSQQNVPIIIDYTSKLPKYLKGDPTRLSQIIYNLLDNALKFTPQGEIRLRVSLHKEEKEGCIIQFEIKDTGIGIPQESLNKIFDTYGQVDEERDSKKGGFGIGLSIVKQLIELQQGQLSVKSQIGKGTTFTFSLPYRTPEHITGI